MNLLIGIVPGFFLYCISALGEEVGWRGLLVPQLLKITSFNRTVLITWIVWALWHYPAIIWADYHSGAPRWFDLASLTIAIIGLSALTAWLRVKSGSLWPPVIWHAAHNLLVLAVYPAMTVRKAYSEYVISDFGIGVMVTGILLALVFTRKGKGIIANAEAKGVRAG
jgi:membrane protease YdiL (CAAX protease family)